MSYETINHVNYYLSSSKDFYFVGDNTTSSHIGDGITPTSYEGEIVIEERVKGKKVLEIAQYAFAQSSIKKVTIHAKIRSINYLGFCWCQKLEYINIPSTVTYIGDCALYLGSYYGNIINLAVTVEFVAGRTQNLYIDRNCFSKRSLVLIIYPSEFVPEFKNDLPFFDTSKTVICAPKSFSFYTKQTTTDISQCPAAKYKPRNLQTYNARKNQRRFIIHSFLVCLLTKQIINIQEPTTKIE